MCKKYYTAIKKFLYGITLQNDLHQHDNAREIILKPKIECKCILIQLINDIC
jgi:hypothetical protein